MCLILYKRQTRKAHVKHFDERNETKPFFFLIIMFYKNDFIVLYLKTSEVVPFVDRLRSKMVYRCDFVMCI